VGDPLLPQVLDDRPIAAGLGTPAFRTRIESAAWQRGQVFGHGTGDDESAGVEGQVKRCWVHGSIMTDGGAVAHGKHSREPLQKPRRGIATRVSLPNFLLARFRLTSPAPSFKLSSCGPSFRDHVEDVWTPRPVLQLRERNHVCYNLDQKRAGS